MNSRIAFFLVALSLSSMAGRGQDAHPAAERSRWESHHSIVIGGQTVEYDAAIGSITLRNDQDKESARIFYTSYFRTGEASTSARPILFSYNGGPGSASFWLHMGIMGPRRVVTPNVGQQDPPPYPLVDNSYSLLDKADIVMIDPVGTGFSHPLGETEGKEFWGIDEDAASLTQFIRRFLSESGRWNSPRYLLGESYGTTRSAVLAGHLQRANIDLNGIILVSAVLDFTTIDFPPGADIPFILNLPTYALSAAYHGALPGRPPSDLEAFMKEVESWSLQDYATTLLAGDSVDPGKRKRVLEQMQRYTGLDQDFLERANLRVSASEFRKELLRKRGLAIGRLDTRFAGPSGDLLETTPSFDPQSTAISSAYTSIFNTYIREELGYDGEREYTPSGAARPWNWQRQGGRGNDRGRTPNVAPDLAEALRRNPRLEVLLVNGLYDLATPYFAAVWTMGHMDLPADLRDNIQRADFAAGHMMYVEESLLPRWKQTLDSFIERTSGGGQP